MKLGKFLKKHCKTKEEKIAVMNSVADFHKIVKNYLKLTKLQNEKS